MNNRSTHGGNSNEELRPRGKPIAWLLCGLTVALAVAGITIVFGADEAFDRMPGGLVEVMAFVVFTVSFATVGALLTVRVPRNPIGWIMSCAGLFYATGGLSTTYSENLASSPFSLVERTLMWSGTWTWGIGIGLAGVFLHLLFPDGRLPSTRWKVVALAGACGIVLLAASTALAPGRFEDFAAANPFGVSGADPVLQLAEGVGSSLTFGAVLGAVVSLALRWRRSGGLERQQLKWLAYAGVVVAAGVGISVPLETAFGSSEVATALSNFLISVSLAAIPVAAGVAILKYQLYDIDRVINKTLVYGALTAFLVAGYAVSILVIKALLPIADESPAAVAVSTLGMAALFGPLRTRIQSVVDRRFYRSRYDAARTVEEFGSRLREETNLDELSADLIAVVRETVQPVHASLWLRAERNV